MTSSSSSDHINSARKRLEEALGPDKKAKYFYYMKQWFRMRMTKEEFDMSARDLLALNTVHLHNDFLLAIFAKCQLFHPPSTSATVSRSDSHHYEQRVDGGGGGGGVGGWDHSTNLHSTTQSDRKKLKAKKKNKPPRPNFDSNFEAVSVQSVAIPATLHDPQAIMDAGAGYMSRSMCLLDTGPLKGRLLLAAWDHGITQVADNVATMLQEATQQCLKNILIAIISRRRGYRLREGCFVHSLGTTPPNPWLRNTASLSDWTSESLGLPVSEGGDIGERPVWPTVDLAEQNAAHLASCAPQVEHPLPPISCRDLFETLQVHKSVLPCHSVYILGLERISSRVWHPSWGEVEQEVMATQEATLRDALKEHRLAANPVN